MNYNLIKCLRTLDRLTLHKELNYFSKLNRLNSTPQNSMQNNNFYRFEISFSTVEQN